MNTNTILENIEKLAELKAFQEELNAEIESIKQSLKKEMIRRKVDELSCGKYTMRYKSIVSDKFDSSSFKKSMPDVYASFIKQTSQMRFSITWGMSWKFFYLFILQ